MYLIRIINLTLIYCVFLLCQINYYYTIPYQSSTDVWGSIALEND